MTNVATWPSREDMYETGKAIVLAAPMLHVDVDVEADGIAGYGSLRSIGAQSPTGETFYREMQPSMAEYMQSQHEFCEAHGLERERLTREAAPAGVVMDEFDVWVRALEKRYNKRPVVTAWGADMEASFLKLYFAQAGYVDDEYPFALMPLDLKSLAMPLNGEWDWTKTKKKHLPDWLVPEGDFTHHALEDAQYQQQIHFGMAALLGSVKYGQVVGSTRNPV